MEQLSYKRYIFLKYFMWSKYINITLDFKINSGNAHVLVVFFLNIVECKLEGCANGFFFFLKKISRHLTYIYSQNYFKLKKNISI